MDIVLWHLVVISDLTSNCLKMPNVLDTNSTHMGITSSLPAIYRICTVPIIASKCQIKCCMISQIYIIVLQQFFSASESVNNQTPSWILKRYISINSQADLIGKSCGEHRHQLPLGDWPPSLNPIHDTQLVQVQQNYARVESSTLQQLDEVKQPHITATHYSEAGVKELLDTWFHSL